MEGKTLKDAVRFSSAAAALCVTKLGAQPSAPTRDEIDDFMKNNSF
jgi:ribokinase